MFDNSHPWFRQLWVRVLLLAVTGGWGLMELLTGSPGWAMLFLGVAGWVIWALFLNYAPPGQDTDDEGESS